MGRVELFAGAGALAAGAMLYQRRQERPSEAGAGTKVVVLGGGFAGLSAARRLAERLPRAETTVVDQHDFHLFTPMLYQVATCGVGPYDIAYPLRQFVRQGAFRLRQGTVQSVDFAARRVQLDNGTLDYDYLLIALGSTTNFFGNRGAQEHALPLKQLSDGMAIRNQLLGNLGRAAEEADAAKRRALLTLVIVGGGATGVELAAATADLLQHSLPADYPSLSVDESRIVVVEAEGALLGHMGDAMAEIALKRLEALGVDVRLKVKATAIEPGQVSLSDGTTLQASTIVWTAGVEASRAVAGMNLKHAKAGTVPVDATLRAEGQDRVFIAGDCSSYQPAGASQPLPMLGAVAVQEGEQAAENIVRAAEGRALQPFHYVDFGNVVALGYRHGAVSALGVTLDGLPGWLAWRVIHLAKNTGFRNQLATVIDWTMGYREQRNLARLDSGPEKASHTQGK